MAERRRVATCEVVPSSPAAGAQAGPHTWLGRLNGWGHPALTWQNQLEGGELSTTRG